MLADVDIHWDGPHDEGAFFLGAGEGYVGVAPIPGARRYRFFVEIFEQLSPEHVRKELSLETFQRLASARGQRMTLSEASSMTIAEFRHRMVNQLQSGRVFLAGDAAHIGSPIGGQYMNLGINEAYNLGWKLAYVSLDRADARLLDSYHAERMPVAREAERTQRRGVLMRDAGDRAPGGMLAVAADENNTAKLIRDSDARLEIANLNTAAQTVVAGTEKALHSLASLCDQRGIRAVRLKTACAFHSSAMANAQPLLRDAARALMASGQLRAPQDVRVVANCTARDYPNDVNRVPELLSEQLVSRVRWYEGVAFLYERGARVFVEVGPGRVLTGTLRANLGDAPSTLLCCDPGDGDPRSHWLALLAQLYVQGIDLSLAGWGDGFVHPTRMDMPAVVVERAPASVPETGLRKLSSRKPAKAARVHARRDRTGAPGGAGSPLQKGMDRVMQPSGARREAVPPFLQDNSDVVRKYFDLSARVLDVAGALRDEALDSQALTRFMELNAEVAARYLELQQSALGRELYAPLSALAVDGTARVTDVRSSAAPRLRLAAAAGAAGVGDAALPSDDADDPLSWLTTELSSITGFSATALGEDVSLADLAIDSLAQASLFERISKRRPDVRARELASARTLGALARLLRRPAQQPGESSIASQREDWEAWLKSTIARVTGFPVEGLSRDAAFSDLGIDSLGFASLLEAAVQRSLRGQSGNDRLWRQARRVSGETCHHTRVDEGPVGASSARSGFGGCRSRAGRRHVHLGYRHRAGAPRSHPSDSQARGRAFTFLHVRARDRRPGRVSRSRAARERSSVSVPAVRAQD